MPVPCQRKHLMMKLPNTVIYREKSDLTIYPSDSTLHYWKKNGDKNSNLGQIEDTMKHLEQAGWYWGQFTAIEARKLLNLAPEGSFLIRDSASSENLFTLSVKTSVGPTHIRICYKAGHFGFDSSILAKLKLQSFKDAVDLIQFYYLASLRHASQLDPPKQDTSYYTIKEPAVHLKLINPLYISMPTLQHLCRLVINRSTQQVTALPLPVRLKDYLFQYPYQL